MDTIPIGDIINQLLGFCRDILMYFAPLIGILAGLKFITDWMHTLLFGRKV